MKVFMVFKFHHKFAMRVPLLVLFILAVGSPVSAVEQSILETRDLIVVYDAGLEPAGRQAAAEYPSIRQALESLLQWAVDFRPTLVLFKDNKRFQILAGNELVVAYAVPNKNVMVVDYSKTGSSPFMLRTTLKHELCHLVLHHYIRDDHLPRWLDEGICQWASDGFADIIMDPKQNRLPAAILSGTYFDLERLRHQFPQDNHALMLAYEQSKSVVEYLSAEYGPQGVSDFLKLLQKGYDLNSAFERCFAIPFDEFQYRWRAYLKKNINWFTYLSIHLYEILFVSAALLTILGFVRVMVRRRAYSTQADEEDGG
jgi:hypothetical protein